MLNYFHDAGEAGLSIKKGSRLRKDAKPSKVSKVIIGAVIPHEEKIAARCVSDFSLSDA